MKKIFRSLILVVLCCISGHITAQDAIITIGQSGYTTYSSEKPLDFSKVTDAKGKPAELSVYTVSSVYPNGNVCILKTGNEKATSNRAVNEFLGMVVKGNPGTYHVQYATETPNYSSSLLTPVITPVKLNPSDGTYTFYVLSEDGFFSPVSSEGVLLGANTAYLKVHTTFVNKNSINKFTLVEAEEDGWVKVK